MTDFQGRDLTPGDEVIYPTRRGSQMWLSRGHIEAVDSVARSVKVRVSTTDGKRVVWVNADRCVVTF